MTRRRRRPGARTRPRTLRLVATIPWVSLLVAAALLATTRGERPALARDDATGLRGRLLRVGSERAVEGARVTVVGTDREGRGVVREVGCDPSGRFLVPDLPPGEAYLVHLSAYGLPFAEIPSVAVAEDGATDLGTIALDRPGHLEGRVLDDQGQAVADAVLRLHGNPGLREGQRLGRRVFGDWDHVFSPLREVRSGGEGRFRIPEVPPGPVCFWASAPGRYGRWRWTRVVPAGVAQESVEVRLESAPLLQGVVLTEAGEAVAGARVVAVPGPRGFGAYPRRLFARSAVTTDAKGAFRLDALPTRSSHYALFVRAAGYPLALQSTPADGTPRIVLSRSAEIRVRVVAAGSARPIAGAEIGVGVIRNALPWEPYQDEWHSTHVTATTDQHGEARVRTCPGQAGMLVFRHPEWGVAASAGGHGGLRIVGDGKIVPGENVLTVELAGGVPVMGRVLDGRGRPIPGARCSWLAGQYGLPQVPADAEGRFRIYWPDIGHRPVLIVTAPGRVQDPLTLEPDLEPVPGRSEALRCTIVLRRPTRVAGRVVDGDGHPVRGATVWLSFHAEDVGFGTGYLDCPSEIACPDGCYVLDGLPPGTRVSLDATSLEHEGRSSAEVVRTSTDGVVRVPDLVLR